MTNDMDRKAVIGCLLTAAIMVVTVAGTMLGYTRNDWLGHAGGVVGGVMLLAILVGHAPS